MSEPRMPSEIIAWMGERNWGMHHLEWHTSRQWDLLSDVDRAWAVSQGWHRADKQEGTAGNGFEFLLMHRAMIELLRETFPAHGALFAGWGTPPTDPRSTSDPMPFNGNPRPFNPNMRDAVRKLHSPAGLAAFADDDAIGLFIETNRRPTQGDPRARSTDPMAGLHNYLHNRFSDSSSDIDLGDPQVNLSNARFWRLHGWIDARWSAFRAAKGWSDNEPAFRDALRAEKEHLRNMGGHVHHPVMAAAVAAAPVRARAMRMPAAPETANPVPASIRNPFRPSVSQRFASAMASGAPVNLDELKERIQLAIELEFFTIPPYLTAAWSLSGSTSPTTIKIREILIGVALQEMLHMGLMCNLLVAVGGKPVLNAPDHLPSYPNFPPGLQLASPIGLEAFSMPVLEQFLNLEHPQNDPVPIPVLVAAIAEAPALSFPTIGEFYDSLKAGLVHATSFSTTGQLTTQFSTTNDTLTVIANAQEAAAAIELIKEQGEGNASSPAAGPSSDELAHFYRFQQIKDGREYVKQPDGTFKQDPSKPLPYPDVAEIYPMAPIPPAGYPGISDSFDTAYSDVLQSLHDAWNQGSQSRLFAAIGAMFGLEGFATALMKTPRSNGQSGNYGPTFRWKPSVTRPPEPPVGPPPTATGYARIQQILDQAVQGQSFGAHGPFWRNLTRDQFVAKAVFGQKLLAVKADGTFDPVESNLVKALEGRAPFDGTVFPRMPLGFPPLADPQLSEIQNWIAQGCPDVVASAGWVDATAGGPVNGQQHIDYWRDFDDWAMFNASEQVSADIGVFFGLVSKWMDFAKDATQEAAWAAALAPANVRDAVGRLEEKQRSTVVAHYGQPVPLLTLLDGYERFGDNSLPDDPQRPADVRHTMNGDTMWFVWSAFVDACLRIGGAIPAEFWNGMARAILEGLLNDGLFRGRFTVHGFTADPAGKAAIRAHVRGLSAADLPAELQRRYRDFLS